MKGKLSNDYVRTDLAVESGAVGDAPGVEFGERQSGSFTVTSMRVTSGEGERISGKPRGTYVTVALGRPWLLGDDELQEAEDLLADEIRKMSRAMSGCRSVLVVGLGNRAITADALGPQTTDGLLITRHIKLSDEKVYESLAQLEVSALAPGVLGQTGIETLELVRGAVERVSPELVVVVDALAARGVDRLASTVQLSDVGLSPGSGIGNARRALDEQSLGVPVMAIGAPTVVNSATLVRDALELAGIDEVSSELESVLENGRSFFVSLKECDVAVTELSGLIARALNRAFSR